MIEQFINFVIRPPRAEYNPDQYLWETDFTLAGKSYKRQDLELTNSRGHRLRCSHYVPSSFPKDTPLPCVIYCHGNSGCRADANEAVIILLPSNITVFALDFSGSGLSDGEFVSLGWHERDDLQVAVSYLRSIRYISTIGLWGRSMGAVTCLLYGAEDPSISGMVLDSAFSNLYDLMLELADVYKIRVPKFTVRMAVQYMRRIIIRKAKFDIMDLNCLQAAPKIFIPALFGHANEDKFIQPRHSDLIFKLYAGDKNIVKFDGDHNSSRPQLYYDSVSNFFHNVLHPPQSSPSCPTKDDKYFDLANLKISGNVDENFLYEIIATLRSVGADSASPSSIFPGALTTKSSDEHISVNDDLTKGDRLAGNCITQLQHHTTSRSDTSHEQNQLLYTPRSTPSSKSIQDPSRRVKVLRGTRSSVDSSQDNENDVSEECCSLTSSTRKSWGRCSSFGGSDDEPAENSHQTALNAIATPRRSFPCRSINVSKQEKEKEKKPPNTPNRSRHERFDKLEALSQRLRLCIRKGASHQRQQSS